MLGFLRTALVGAVLFLSSPLSADAIASLHQAQQAARDGDGYLATKCYLNALAENPNIIECQFTDYLEAYTPPYPGEAWAGNKPLNGKTVFVYPQKGLGDTIQFCRYLPALAERGATVLLLAPAPLRQALRDANLSGVTIIDEKQAAVQREKADYVNGLLSIPAALKLKEIPLREGYLCADPTRIARYREQYFNTPNRKIGIVWTGDPSHPHNGTRSVDLLLLSEALADGDVQLYSFQVGPAQADLRANFPDIIDLGATFGRGEESFANLLAALANLDHFVSIDSSPCHAASALTPGPFQKGGNVWILLPSEPDLRWVDDHRWYQRPNVLRQERKGDWSKPLAILGTQLDGRSAENQENRTQNPLGAAGNRSGDKEVKKVAI